jgi:hypothetical protein
MEKGALDQIAINTAGIGVADTIIRDSDLSPAMQSLSPGHSEIMDLRFCQVGRI